MSTPVQAQTPKPVQPQSHTQSQSQSQPPEVPLRLIKANQAGIVVLTVAFLLTSQVWLIALLWAIQFIGLATSGRWNVFVRLAKLFPSTRRGDTQAADLNRFNNTLAVLFLTFSAASLALGWTVAGYVFAVGLLGAAGAALAGYCIGCTLYYQYKRLVRRVAR